MADTLKAEGNKLFAEKKFKESMYIPPHYPSLSGHRTDLGQ
jgi:hypothetical protein